MSTFIDFSGTEGLPDTSELESGGARILHHGFSISGSLQQVHAKWSLLAGTYAAPEQFQVHGAMDGPREAGEAVLRAATQAVSALRDFAAAVDAIRRKRLEFQAEAALLDNECNGTVTGAAVPAVDSQAALRRILLQDKADQLALELSTAEDDCMRALADLERSADAPERRGL